MLSATLDAATQSDKDTRIFLRADRAVPYGDVMEVMNLLRAAGYLKVALVGSGKSIAAMIAVSHEDLTDLRRWLISGALVILAHGGIAAAMVTWHEAVEPSEPSGAILVEFAPLPAAPPARRPSLRPDLSR